MDEAKIPRIGCAVIIFKEGKVLLGERHKSHDKGSWGFPGGHLEYGETPEECAVRETREEAGVEINNLRRVSFTNDFFEEEGKHYVTLFFAADWLQGEPREVEPGTTGNWNWFEPGALPSPLMLSIRNLLEQGVYLSKA